MKTTFHKKHYLEENRTTFTWISLINSRVTEAIHNQKQRKALICTRHKKSEQLFTFIYKHAWAVK